MSDVMRNRCISSSDRSLWLILTIQQISKIVILLTLPKGFRTRTWFYHIGSARNECGTLMIPVMFLNHISFNNSTLRSKISINSELNSWVISWLLPWWRLIIRCHGYLWIIISTFKVNIFSCAPPWAWEISSLKWSSSWCCSARHGTRPTHLLALQPCFNLVRGSGYAHNTWPLTSVISLKINFSRPVLHCLNKFPAAPHI